MLGRIDFQRNVDTVDSKSKGVLHKAKLAGFIYDLVEEKCGAIEKQIKELNPSYEINNEHSENKHSSCGDCRDKFQAIADDIAGLGQKMESLTMKIEEVETKIGRVGKPKKKVVLKNDKK